VFEVQETIKKDVEEDAELGSVRHTFFVPNDTGAFFYLMTVMLLIFVLSRGEEVLAFNKDSGFFLPTFVFTLAYLNWLFD
jgi:hypothetical protein